MPTQLPSDPVLLEQAIRAAIRDILLSVPLIALGVAKVSLRERFPDSDDEDLSISTVPDLENPELPFTSLIQIGIPTVEEKEYVNDKSTQLTLTYPITFDMDVKDKWKNIDLALDHDNSTDLLMAIYMQARRSFKFDVNGVSKRTLGFENCVHGFLQQEAVGTVQVEDETGGSLHTADWSLEVKVTGILN